MTNLTYDQICHEHITYYTLSVFKKIAEKNNLKIISISMNEINGGSIEIICSKRTSRFKPNKKKIKLVLKNEEKITKQAFKNFNLRIKKTKNLLRMFVKLNSTKKIIGYGASTKGNVVLNHCEIKNL